MNGETKHLGSDYLLKIEKDCVYVLCISQEIINFFKKTDLQNISFVI